MWERIVRGWFGWAFPSCTNRYRATFNVYSLALVSYSASPKTIVFKCPVSCKYAESLVLRNNAFPHRRCLYKQHPALFGAFRCVVGGNIGPEAKAMTR